MHIYPIVIEVINWTENQMINVSTLLYTIIATIVTYGVYYICFRPINRIRNLGEVGYGYLEDEAKTRGRQFKDYINYIKSLKKVGNIPPVYANGWYALLESQDLKKGEVKSVASLGETFAVFRSKDGEVYVLDAYCPHLGADLGVGGVLFDSCIECPFHGWQFDGKTGECVKIPYSNNKIPPNSSVKKWKSIEKTGSIYIWYHAENEEPTWFPPDVEAIASGNWVYRGRSEHSFTAHIQDVVENASDVAHFGQVHTPTMLAGVDLKNLRTNPFLDLVKHVWTSNWEEGGGAKSHTVNLTITHAMMIFGKISLFKAKVNAILYGPGIVHLHMSFPAGECVFIQTCMPIGPLDMRMVHQIYASKYMPTIYSNIVMLTESIMIERDMMVWTNKKYLSKPVFVKEDRYLARHRKWFSQFYSENSPTLSTVKESLSW